MGSTHEIWYFTNGTVSYATPGSIIYLISFFYFQACPVKKGLYNIKDFTPDASLIPAALPGGDYHVEVMAELIQGGKTVSTLLSAKVHATVDG